MAACGEASCCTIAGGTPVGSLDDAQVTAATFAGRVWQQVAIAFLGDRFMLPVDATETDTNDANGGQGDATTVTLSLKRQAYEHSVRITVQVEVHRPARIQIQRHALGIARQDRGWKTVLLGPPEQTLIHQDLGALLPVQ